MLSAVNEEVSSNVSDYLTDEQWYDMTLPDYGDTAEQFCASGSTYEEMELFEVIGFRLEVVCLIVCGVFGFCGNLVAIPVLLSKPIANLFNREEVQT